MTLKLGKSFVSVVKYQNSGFDVFLKKILGLWFSFNFKMQYIDDLYSGIQKMRIKNELFVQDIYVRM